MAIAISVLRKEAVMVNTFVLMIKPEERLLAKEVQDKRLLN